MTTQEKQESENTNNEKQVPKSTPKETILDTIAHKSGGIQASRLLRYSVFILHYLLIFFLIYVIAYEVTGKDPLPLKELLIYIAGILTGGVQNILTFVFPNNRRDED